MKRRNIIFLLIGLSVLSHAQVVLIGHNMINNTPVQNTRIIVKTNGAITQTLGTGARQDFKLILPFGVVHQIYFQNAKSPVMYMEVDGTGVPKEKIEYMMTYELNVPFADKRDEDVDTVKFQRAFYKIAYNGLTRMAEDTLYNNVFANELIRKANSTEGQPLAFAGLLRNSNLNGPKIQHVKIALLDKNHAVIKRNTVDRHGCFVFTNTDAGQIDAMRVERSDDSIYKNVNIQVADLKGNVITETVLTKTETEIPNAGNQFQKLNETNFNTHIGGKLISSSMREKKFFANKPIYLCNRYNTVLQKTRTTAFGTFAFENIKPEKLYYLAVDKGDVGAGERIDLLTKNDKLISVFDTVTAGRLALKVISNFNQRYDKLLLGDEDLKMDIHATIFGDNVNNPIGNLKIVLLNDQYEVIDSVITDNYGSFKFKYLPFLKRFYLSAENTDNVLDVFKNILIYSSESNLVKIMTHQKGTKFTYKPVNTEMSVLRDIELEDPWLELVADDIPPDNALVAPKDNKIFVKGSSKLIVENIMFENNKSEISADAKQILDKVILVLNHNKNLRIEVGAHTDSKGSAAANMKLSESRAKMVQEYIISAGINSNRIQSKGYGESKLINNCTDNVECTETEHALNRRIEFRILGEQSTNQ